MPRVKVDEPAGKRKVGRPPGKQPKKTTPEGLWIAPEVKSLQLKELKVLAYKMLLLHRKGYTVREISDEMGLSHNYIATSLPKLLDAETDKLREMQHRELPIQLGRIDYMISALMKEWEKSCGNRLETTEAIDKNIPAQAEGVSKETGGKVSKSTKTLTGIGDPRLIQEVRQLMQTRLKLLGLDRPEVVERVMLQLNITNIAPDVNSTAHAQQVSFTPEETLAIAEALRATGQVPRAIQEAIGPPAEPHVIEGEFISEEEYDGVPNQRHQELAR